MQFYLFYTEPYQEIATIISGSFFHVFHSDNKFAENSFKNFLEIFHSGKSPDFAPEISLETLNFRIKNRVILDKLFCCLNLLGISKTINKTTTSNFFLNVIRN